MRKSGILMPVTALPSKHGIGTIGEEAYRFIDFLKKSGQAYWQILPIGPTGFGDSPYQSFSAYAGNPYWIDLDLLVSYGVLNSADIKRSGFIDDPDLVCYGDIYKKRFNLLRKAALGISRKDEAFRDFCVRNEEWLDGYALFMSIKAANDMVSFHEWPAKYRIYKEKTAEKAKKKYKAEIHFWRVLQYLFYKQWAQMKSYANSNGIQIIGDMPIYVSPDSADLWIRHELFQVNKSRDMIAVAGCPPDAFAVTGQRWGNPLYAWDYHKACKYEWWMKRMKHAAATFDAVRIDHFRGFAGYYSIPAAHETAVDGEWVKGPGRRLISKMKKTVPELAVIAEDLGYLTADVRRLLKHSGFPGMKVLQFAFDESENSDYLPHKYTENSVVYTGTHDNPTTREWADTITPAEEKFARRYLKLEDEANLTEELVKAAMESKSDLCIIALQDWLQLGKEARINTPGTPEGNWRFRVRKEMLSDELAEKIMYMTKASNRIVETK